jgi:hypothetical protein
MKGMIFLSCLRYAIYQIYLVLFILNLDISLIAQLSHQGNNYLEYSIDTKNDERYFEDWLDFSLQYKNWRAGIRYEIHLPPQPFSLDTVGQGIYQRFIEYSYKNFFSRLGNFYTMLGRGLVLRSFEERLLRWDTNVDGIRLLYYSNRFDLELLGGRMRDRTGVRRDIFQGGQFTYKPLSLFQLGGTFVVSKFNIPGEVYWGSIFSILNFNFGDLYVEYASKDFPDIFPKGHALYLAMNLFLGPVSLLTEYKDYKQYKIEEGVTYNNPPTAIREHLYTLLNRRQPEQNANNEKGHLVQAVYPVIENAILTGSYSRTNNQNKDLQYEDIYFQVELDYPSNLEWVWAGGQQKDLVARYFNFVNTTLFNFSGFNSIKLQLEHQHAKTHATNRQYYDQIISLSFSRAPNWTISALSERSTDQTSEKEFWMGFQLDAQIFPNYDLTIFAGSRRKGKLCLGGNCVNRPAFEGLEFRLINRF